MQIKDIPVSKIHPYEMNTKIHTDEQVTAVANSIKEFGWKQPIVIDKAGVIVVGHGRFAAAKRLGLKKVPCVVVDDLTEEQVRAYRIADNKTNESEWDFGALEAELAEISVDMGQFGIEMPEPEDNYYEEDPNGYYGDERERTFNALNFNDYDETRVEGRFDMPVLKPVDYIPKRLLGFNYAKTSNDYDSCIHFYLDDYQFERIWNRPKEYFELLAQYDACMTPNFSIYLDMPEAMKIWNTYRARMLGQMMQDYGLTVVPIVYWSDSRSYEWCFDGIPEHSTISVNNIGNQVKEAKRLWDLGMDELIRRKKPKRILLYGNGMEEDYDFGDIEVITFKNSVTERMKESKKG